MRGRNPLINICYSGKFFELWITILRMLCLISHIVRLILAQLFLSTLIFTVLKPFLERSYHHGDAQALPPTPPLPEILSLLVYLVFPTHLPKQAQTVLVSLFSQLIITLYICLLMNADTVF